MGHGTVWAKDPYYDEIVSIHPFHDAVNLSDVYFDSRQIKVIMFKLLK